MFLLKKLTGIIIALASLSFLMVSPLAADGGIFAFFQLILMCIAGLVFGIWLVFKTDRSVPVAITPKAALQGMWGVTVLVIVGVILAQSFLFKLIDSIWVTQGTKFGDSILAMGAYLIDFIGAMFALINYRNDSSIKRLILSLVGLIVIENLFIMWIASRVVS